MKVVVTPLGLIYHREDFNVLMGVMENIVGLNYQK
jgi:hypothetical protein